MTHFFEIAARVLLIGAGLSFAALVVVVISAGVLSARMEMPLPTDDYDYPTLGGKRR